MDWLRKQIKSIGLSLGLLLGSGLSCSYDYNKVEYINPPPSVDFFLNQREVSGFGESTKIDYPKELRQFFFFEFLLEQSYVPIDYALALVNDFDEAGICYLFEKGVNISYAQSLAGNFSYYDITKFFENKVDPDYANALAGQECYDIFTLHNHRVPINYVLSLSDLLGEQDGFFWLIRNFESGHSVELVKSYLSVLDGSEFIYFASKEKVPLEYLRELKSLRNRNGYSIFSEKDIFDLVFKFNSKEGLRIIDGIREIPLDYIKSMLFVISQSEYLDISGSSIVKLNEFGFTKNYPPVFIDGIRPNALVVYGVEDFNDGFIAEVEIEQFKQIWNAYDVMFVLTGNEDVFYRALDVTPDIEFLMISGHGSDSSLRFGEEDLENKFLPYEKYSLDLLDWELKWHLGNLSPLAIIFLNSCANGEGEDAKENLANFVALFAQGKLVFSSKASFAAPDSVIESLYPFKVKITVDGEDATYFVIK